MASRCGRARRWAAAPRCRWRCSTPTSAAITLNLKTPRGVELLKALARRADVLLENFAPGVMDRLGVGAAALMAENPRLIYASATGYGLSGAERDNLAMDITIQAASGAISVTGFPDGPPVKAGPAIADFLSGTHLYGAIVTALFERERTGRGPAGRGGDDRDHVPDPGLQPRHGPQQSRPAAGAHRQPPRRPRGLALQRLRLQGRLVRHHLQQRRRIGAACCGRWAATTWRTTRASPPTPPASSTWPRPTRWSKAWAADLHPRRDLRRHRRAQDALGAGARPARGAGQRSTCRAAA